MDEFAKRQILQAKFAAALANPIPGKRPILKLIRPHFKRPPFNRTHKILRRRHRKKDKISEHYNVPVSSYYALRWVKADKLADPEPGVIVSLEQFADIHPRVVPSPVQSPQQDNSVAQNPPAASGPALQKNNPPPPAPKILHGDDDTSGDEYDGYEEVNFPSQEGEVIFNGDSRSLPAQDFLDTVYDMPEKGFDRNDDIFAPLKKRKTTN